MEEPGGLQSMGSLGVRTTERLHFHFSLSCIGEGNGNPLQCSCLENPREGGTWWAAVPGSPGESGLVSRGSQGLRSPLESDGYILEPTEWLKGSQTSSGVWTPSMGFSRQEYWSGLPFPSPMRENKVAQSCLTLRDPVDYSPPGSSVHGLFQARVLEWVAMPSSRGSSRPSKN